MAIMIKSFTFNPVSFVARAEVGAPGVAATVVGYFPPGCGRDPSQVCSAARELSHPGDYCLVNDVPVLLPERPSQAHEVDWSTGTWKADAASLAANLANQIRRCLEEVQVHASNARARYLTPGQEDVYREKTAQAKAWSSSGFSGEAPPYIRAEAQRLGLDPMALTWTVLGRAQHWASKGPEIEAARQKWRDKLKSAEDEQAAKLLLADARLEFAQL